MYNGNNIKCYVKNCIEKTMVSNYTVYSSELSIVYNVKLLRI